MSSPTPPAPTGDNRFLNRLLKSRHLMMIPTGGAIGTGLFAAFGVTIPSADPGGTLLTYGLIGFMVRFVMQSFGEMVAFLPVSGSFGEYGHRLMSPSFGFAMGWNYWFNWVTTVTVELIAVALVMKYWFPHVLSILRFGFFLLILSGINALSIKAYGEFEFWFAMIRVPAVIVFLILGPAMVLGIIGEAPGAQNWTVGEAPSVGGAEGVFLAILVAGYSFQGTELIGVAAGKAEDPGRMIPRAIRTIFWRILLFYIDAVAAIGFSIPYTDPSFFNSPETSISVNPFTLVFDKAGILAATSLMNAVILTSTLSAGTSGLYVSTRMLFTLAEKGYVPRFLKKLPKHQVPVSTLLVVIPVGLAGFITSSVGGGKAYEFLLTASASAGFITWMGISWSHYRFRKALTIQNISLDSLPHRVRLFLAGAIVALAVYVFIVVGQSYDPLRDEVPPGELLLLLTGILFLPALWAGHKLITKKPAVSLATADLGHE